MGALEHLELAPRGSGGAAAPAPGAPDLLAELENIRTPPVPGGPPGCSLAVYWSQWRGCVREHNDGMGGV